MLHLNAGPYDAYLLSAFCVLSEPSSQLSNIMEVFSHELYTRKRNARGQGNTAWMRGLF